MNIEEYLWTCLGEECTETALAVSKILRFGPRNVRPTFVGEEITGPSNLEHLRNELNDIRAMIELLEEHGLLPMTEPLDDRAEIELKKAKVRYYMSVSRSLDTLQESS